MSYITREDGERFVIPSYRDVISAKKPSLLRREIVLLSQNYGEYITLHRKNIEQYEVSFSPDTGYLLGETVWHYFKRPLDLIYCEAIPNTTEAILVIVKSGSVYLDGSFPIDSIADELIIFRTQQNNFDIYVYGDVPISKTPEEDKFTFDPVSVRSFQVLDEPAFPKLPKVKNFQLQLVDVVLKSQGIGGLPVKQLLTAAVVVGLIWLAWTLLSSQKKESTYSFVAAYVNPYQVFLDTLSSPDPAMEIHRLSENIKRLYSLPGWVPETIEYSKGKLRVGVKSLGTKTELLFIWARKNSYTIQIAPDGLYLNTLTLFPQRPAPTDILQVNDVISALIDKLANGMPGDHLQIAPFIDKKLYVETALTISFTNITPVFLDWIGLQLVNLPLVLNKVSMTSSRGSLSGSITLQALGHNNL